MPIGADEIETKEFLTTLRGFDREEVRAFLQVIAAEQRKATERIAELEQGLDRATSHIEELENRIRDLGGTPPERAP